MRFTFLDLKRKGYEIKNNIAHRCVHEPQQGHRTKLPRLAGPEGEDRKKAPALDSPKQRVFVLVESYAVQPFDNDNLSFAAKPIIDALRYAGLLIEDDPAHVGLFVISRSVSAYAHERFEITLYNGEEIKELSDIILKYIFGNRAQGEPATGQVSALMNTP